MAENVETGVTGIGASWRIAVWGVAAALLILPLIATQLVEGFAWDLGDFLVFGAMLVVAGLAFEVAARMSGSVAYKAGVCVALAGAFVLVWMSLAVGIIGSDGNPANLMYVGVLAIGIIGALISRFSPSGMALTMFMAAIAQALAGIIAIVVGLGSPASGPLELALLNGFFVVLFLLSAGLFRFASRS